MKRKHYNWNGRFWDDPKFDRWKVALADVEDSHDLKSLLPLLKKCVPAEVYPHLADLVDRYRLKYRGPGKPRTPTHYGMSPHEFEVRWAIEKVWSDLDDGVPREVSLHERCKQYGIDYTTLDGAVAKGRSSRRRMLKRLG